MIQAIMTNTPNCAIHVSYRIMMKVNVEKIHDVDVIEGALDGFCSAFGCTVCASESIGTDVENYIVHFVERFLPILGITNIEDDVITITPFGGIDKIARLGYG
jgi:hypothetical protein